MPAHRARALPSAAAGGGHYLLQASLIQRVAARQRDDIQQHLPAHGTAPIEVHLPVWLAAFVAGQRHGCVLSLKVVLGWFWVWSEGEGVGGCGE
jgi:hypothetical protein